MNEQELLYEYKQYDGINNNKPLVKILVSYIKPSFLFKSEILTPIHLGRAVERDTSKDGVISDEDINGCTKIALAMMILKAIYHL